MKTMKRNLLKLACLIAAILTIGVLFGCSPSQSGGSSSDSRTEGVQETESNRASSASDEAATNDALTEGTAVVYFSATGNTEAVAEKIAAATDGTLMRIEPAEPYTEADLDYNSDCRANTEQEGGSARPALAEPVSDMAQARHHCSIFGHTTYCIEKKAMRCIRQTVSI